MIQKTDNNIIFTPAPFPNYSKSLTISSSSEKWKSKFHLHYPLAHNEKEMEQFLNTCFARLPRSRVEFLACPVIDFRSPSPETRRPLVARLLSSECRWSFRGVAILSRTPRAPPVRLDVGHRGTCLSKEFWITSSSPLVYYTIIPHAYIPTTS